MFRPRLANSLAYSFPIPSVDPVTTETNHKILRENKIRIKINTSAGFRC